ncbi:WYL domain-containing protein [Amycolatopsis rubida]|uniref:WYL domain-containing protein n=1 Tax=Amycolatopsis rubida TaxID=112413 RepID=A0ABX0BTP8_9PSEU|nr:MULTISPECIES: WYL domain-containing protein [Amycolatopsis]MYW92536.1 WYL domain-containing protein [Amycolatopsis rubida]NEC57522.1 WYL domain-containing protein [Amycolatopsis rubida]OAP20082.1 Bifunctional ligase/repressor BirA [Amycolatopsis sp. M39]
MTTTSRRLETLALLQARPGISATDLAARLGVAERTTRRDIAQLRELGYRIDGEPGRAGGYRLAHGTAMPPLLLDADEVAAVSLGLQTAVTVDGLETATVTALAKLTQVVPTRWQTRLAALAEVESLPGKPFRQAARDILVPIALACRAGEAVRIRHRAVAAPSAKPVDVQPYRLITVRRQWYLVACPRGTSEWKTFAVERIEAVQPLGIKLPAPEPPSTVADLITNAGWRHRVRVQMRTSADLVRELVDPGVATVVEDGDECELRFGTDDLDWAARWLAYLDVDFDVLEPPALTDRLHAFGAWLADRYVTTPPD